MSDYQISLVIRNGRLHGLMRQHGYQSMRQLSMVCGVDQVRLGMIGNLKMSAYNKSGEVRPQARRLADFFGVLVDDLFPPELLHQPIERNKWEASVSSDEARRLLGPVDTYVPDCSGQLDTDGTFEKILALADLTSREKQVLTARFIEDQTLVEVGKSHGISSNRARQIEQGAMKKLRASQVLRRDHNPDSDQLGRPDAMVVPFGESRYNRAWGDK